MDGYADTDTGTVDRKSTVDRAMSFPMGEVVERYAKEHGLSMEIAWQHARELKRYLALCALNPDARYGMSGPVDNLWHMFIIFTRMYAQFCEEVAGRFIHHNPVRGRNDDNAGTLAEDNGAFFRDYENVFGEPAPTHLWPSAGHGRDCDGSRCNRGVFEISK